MPGWVAPSLLAFSSNFEGHCAIMLLRSATKTPFSIVPDTMTSRPALNVSGTLPR